MDKKCHKTFSSEKKQTDTYKLLKRGRSRVLFVSMATILGTRELITEDLHVQERHVSNYEGER